MTFTPTFTRLERAALKLLIKFGWGNDSMADHQEARRLVVLALELNDDRPVNMEERKAALNAFMARPDPAPTSELFPVYGSVPVE